MRHFSTLSIIILSLLFISAGKAYCDDANFLTTEGGTYKLINAPKDYHDNNIILVASYTSEVNQKYVLMTTETNTNSGIFGFATHGNYNFTLKDTLVVKTVNTTNDKNVEETYFPFEYIADSIGNSKNVPYVTLKDYNKNYIYKEYNNNNILLTQTYNKTKCEGMINKFDERPTIVLNNGAKRIRYSSDGFVLSGSFTSTTETYIYKKVYPLAIGSTGYATLYYGTHDLILPEGLTAYTYTLSNNELSPSTTITAGETIPAGTAVVIKAATPDKTYYLDIIAHKSDAFTSDNYLHGTDENAITTALTEKNETAYAKDCYFYYLTNGSTGFGFRWREDDGAAFTNNAHKAYLCIPKSVFESSSAKAIEFILPTDDDPSPVLSVPSDNTVSTPLDDKCYDLSGKRIAEPQHGTFIKQGKKICKVGSINYHR